jgi:hypothetical protein
LLFLYRIFLLLTSCPADVVDSVLLLLCFLFI